MIHMADMKNAIVRFMDTEVVPKAPSDKKIIYVRLGILAPKLVDKMVAQYAEMLKVADILCEDNMVNVEAAESFFSQLLTKTGGYTVAGIRMTADDVHKLADMARVSVD